MTTKEKIYIGALLHDIGKFWQRTEWKQQFKAHQKQSEDFVSACFPDEADKIIRIASAYHHYKDLAASDLSGDERLFAEIFYEADNLASWERERDPENRDKNLLNVFNLVRNKDGEPPTGEKTFQPICRLSPQADLYQMPVEASDSNAAFLKKTKEKWEEFEKAFIEEAKNGKDLTTLYHLCKKYLWCQTSAFWLNSPEISLFEHSRLTAAIAVCMYDFFKDKIANGTLQPSDIKNRRSNEGTGNVLDRTKKCYLLVLADLSGIQDYIYNIAHDNALKALKGRSFYLQHLMDGVAMQILKELSLLDSHLLYSGGGVFYLLLPNTETAKNTLEKNRKTVATDLLRDYHGLISLNFAQVELSGIDFEPEKIQKIWSDLSDKRLRRNKYCKSIVFEKSDFFVDENIPSGGVKTCDATGIELAETVELETIKDKFFNVKRGFGLEFREYTIQNNRLYQRPKKEEDVELFAPEEEGYTDNFISQEQFDAICIGQLLKRGSDEVRIIEKAGEFSIPGGLKLQLVNVGEHLSVTGFHRAYLLNHDDFLSVGGKSRGWKFYGGNWFPTKIEFHPTDKNKSRSVTATFDDLRQEAKGLKYLAVLRMDVDKLGEIFRSGLEKPPFSRIVQLSNLLDFFFSGYLNRLRNLKWNVERGVNPQEGESLEEALQIVYAGGDDLCIVGKWHLMPDVACWIREQFEEFTGRNPNLTLSGGIALFGQKYPLFKVAERAGEAEKKAKNYRRCLKTSNPQKTTDRNAFCFLDNPLGWNDFEEVRRLARLFYQWYEHGVEHEGRVQKLPRSFVQLIQDLFYEFSGGKTIAELLPGEIEKRRFGPWRWHTAYLLSRMGERNRAFQKEITQIATDIFTGSKTDQEYLLVVFTAAQWADFLTRENNN